MRSEDLGISGLVLRAEALRGVLHAVDSLDPEDAYEILSEAANQVRRLAGLPLSPLRLPELESTVPRGTVPPALPPAELPAEPTRALRKDYDKERKKRTDPKKPALERRGKLRPANESSTAYIATAPRYGIRVTKILELLRKKPLLRAEIDQALRVGEDKAERHRVGVQLAQMKRDGLVIQNGKGTPWRLAG